MPSRFQQIFERSENALIIVDYGNEEAGRRVSGRVHAVRRRISQPQS